MTRAKWTGLLVLVATTLSTFPGASPWIPVPLVSQAASYSCGPAALLSVVRYFGDDVLHESDLYALADTTEKDGTEPEGLARAATRLGFRAEVARFLNIDDLREHVRAGRGVILNIQAWPDKPGEIDWASEWESGHYVVVTHIDGSIATVMDPSLTHGYGFVSLDELVARWHDYESRNGVRQENHRLAVLIERPSDASTPLRPFPEAPVHVE